MGNPDLCETSTRRSTISSTCITRKCRKELFLKLHLYTFFLITTGHNQSRKKQMTVKEKVHFLSAFKSTSFQLTHRG